MHWDRVRRGLPARTFAARDICYSASSRAFRSGSASISASSSVSVVVVVATIPFIDGTALGASSPTICPSSFTLSSASTWLVALSVSSSTSLSSNASDRASFRSSSLNFAVSFYLANSFIVDAIFFVSMTLFADNSRAVTLPMAVTHDTCPVMAVACIPNLISGALVS